MDKSQILTLHEAPSQCRLPLFIFLSLSYSFLSLSFFFFFVFFSFFSLFFWRGGEARPPPGCATSGSTFRSDSRKLQMTRRCNIIQDCNQDVVPKYNFSTRVVAAWNRLASTLEIQAQLKKILNINWINICLVGGSYRSTTLLPHSCYYYL